MIDLHAWPTPNGYKPLIALEELGLIYRLVPVNIFKGEQHTPDFLAISPNGRMPAIIDHEPGDGAGPLSLFESGVILNYLAEKAAGLQPRGLRERHAVQQWLLWQVAGLGPMMGQAGHFINYAPEDVPYAKGRYLDEVRRLFGVLERQLIGREYLVDAYSIADIACYPWVRIHDVIGLTIDAAFPALAAWSARMEAREAVQAAYALGEPLKKDGQMGDAARKHLFGASGQASTPSRS